MQIARIRKWNDLRRGVTVNAGLIEGGTRTNVIPDAPACFSISAPCALPTCGKSKNVCEDYDPSIRVQNWKFTEGLSARRWNAK